MSPDMSLSVLERAVMASPDREAIIQYECAARRAGRYKFVVSGISSEEPRPPFDGIYQGFWIETYYRDSAHYTSFEGFLRSREMYKPRTNEYGHRIEGDYYVFEIETKGWVAMWTLADVAQLGDWRDVSLTIRGGLFYLDFFEAIKETQGAGRQPGARDRRSFR